MPCHGMTTAMAWHGTSLPHRHHPQQPGAPAPRGARPRPHGAAARARRRVCARRLPRNPRGPPPGPRTLSMRAPKSAPRGKTTWHGAVDERVDAMRRRRPTKSRHHLIADARYIWYCTWYRDLVESDSIPTASVSRVRGLLSASNFEPGIIAEVIFRHVVVGLCYVSLGANLGARALIADRRQRHSANSRRDLGVPATPSRGGEEGLGRGRRRRRPWRARGAPRRRRRRSCSTTAAECARAGRAARRGCARRCARARTGVRAFSPETETRAAAAGLAEGAAHEGRTVGDACAVCARVRRTRLCCGWAGGRGEAGRCHAGLGARGGPTAL